MKIRSWDAILATGLTIAVVIIPLFVYRHNFDSSHFSKNPEDWSAFGDFYSPFISLGSLIAIGFLTLRLYKLEKNRDKPIVTVENLYPFTLRNIGNSPAMNVRIVVRYKHDEQKRYKQIIAVNETVPFDLTIQGLEGIKVEYQNVHGQSMYGFAATTQGVIPELTKEEEIILFGNAWARLFLKIKTLTKEFFS